ncbi:Bug family tripartite tricarboxylate transporter substrate binding protein [Lacibacterium aquatile]|uniref:Bug family tripartite tricarboxylate transporter substrate binding protein n=1 Tax=Lacibacterium aquatile TaxID=1168082 RepID=A0ABW5DNK0_9PROT
MKIKLIAGLFLALGPLVSPAAAQNFPSKAITVVVPYAAGGPTDTVARLTAQFMGANLGQQMVVENVAGAGGTLGAARVAKSDPDGHTLLIHHIGHAISPAMYRKLPFDAVKDFAPIGLITEAPMTFVARSDFPAQTLKDLIAYVKEHRSQVTFGHGGIGGAAHLCGMLFMQAVETQITVAAYRGTGPAMNDLLGGQIDFMCDQTTTTVSQIKAGRVKVYGATTASRIPALPEVPTLAEAGLPGFEISVWHGLYAPAGTPPAVIRQLSESLKKALAEPELAARFNDLGTDPVPAAKGEPKPLADMLAAEIKKWSPIVRAAGAYAD